MKLKVAFKNSIFIREKELDFVFNIAALECASLEVLKCDLWQISEQNPYDVNVAILYGAYLQSCRERYKKPRYTFANAVIWLEHMSKETQGQFMEAIKELMGRMENKGEDKKKSDMGRSEVVCAGGAGMDFAEIQRCDHHRV